MKNQKPRHFVWHFEKKGIYRETNSHKRTYQNELIKQKNYTERDEKYTNEENRIN